MCDVPIATLLVVVVSKRVNSSQSRPTLGRKAVVQELAENRKLGRYPVTYQHKYSRIHTANTHKESLRRRIAMPINGELLRGFHVVVGHRHLGVVQECDWSNEEMRK